MTVKSPVENKWITSTQLVFFVVTLCIGVAVAKGFLAPIDESSRGLIVDMFFNDSLAVNYPIFGNFISYLFSATREFVLLFGSYSQESIIFGFCRAIFIFSGVLLALFCFRLQDEKAFPAWLAILLLFLDPAYLSLDTLAWRQCLSLAVFVWGESLTRSRQPLAGWMLLIAAVVVHPGNLPLIVLYGLLSALNNHARLVVIASLIFIVMPAFYFFYPLDNSVVPDWLPFRRMMTLEKTFVDSNVGFNNIYGDIVYKYIIFIIPSLIFSSVFIFLRTNIPRYIENILISSVLPIAFFNFVPGTNRMIISFFIIFALYGAVYTVYLLKDLSVASDLARKVAFVVLSVFHVLMYLALAS